jgi:hypothetical protein
MPNQLCSAERCVMVFELEVCWFESVPADLKNVTVKPSLVYDSCRFLLEMNVSSYYMNSEGVGGMCLPTDYSTRGCSQFSIVKIVDKANDVLDNKTVIVCDSNWSLKRGQIQ